MLPEVLYVGELPPRVFVRVNNDSCAEQTIKTIGLPEWITQMPRKGALTIPSGGSASFFTTVNRPLEREALGCLTVTTSAGSGKGELAVIGRNPGLTCEPDRVALWRTSDGRHNLAAVKIRPSRGALKIVGAQASDTQIEVVSDLPQMGRIVDEARYLEVKVGLGSLVGTTGQLMRVEETTQTLVISYQSPHKVETAKLAIKIDRCRPPKMFWPGEFEKPQVRFPTSGQRLTLVIGNFTKSDSGHHNGPLVVERAVLTAPQLSGARIRCLTALPVEIAGAESIPLEFELDLSSESHKPQALTELKLQVQTNLKTKEWRVPLKIEPMPAFDGVVAIDFGSSNSCCAVWQEGGEPKLLRLDDRTGDVSPTVVRYKRLEPPPDIETGARPKDLAAQTADIAASTADHLKQRLGDNRALITIRPEDEARWVERPIVNVASDYLRNVRHKAELAKGARFRDFILTHPARCSLRQYKQLRAALQTAFNAEDGDMRVQFLAEPVAALISYIADREGKSKGEHNDYVAAAFDLGGGTTDISIIRVHCAPGRNGQTRIVPEVLFSCGDRFGGEDLTDFLCDALAERVRAFVQSEPFRSANNMSVAPKLILEEGLGAAIETARLNQNSLRMIAEAFKVSLSDQRASLAESFQIHLQVGSESGLYSVRLADVRSFGGEDIAGLFLAYARAQLTERVAMLKNAIDGCGVAPDVIQISGKTSHLSVVRETLVAAFPSVQIIRAPDPKECVVMGACLTRSMRRGVYIDLDMERPCLTSSIGAYGLASTAFQTIFRVGQPIPDDGLKGTLAQAWDGKGPIVVWEDLKGAVTDVPDFEAAKHFKKLGTWEPEERRELVDGDVWDLHVVLRDFELKVTAVGPNRDEVAFRLI
jgi:Molecular chaperone